MLVQGFKGKFGRSSFKSIVIAGAVLGAGLGIAVYAAMQSTGDVLPVGSKAAPQALVAHSSASLPPEVRALEASTVGYLFDRDIFTPHVAYAASQVEATLDGVQEIRAVKVFGPAPYLLTVKAESGGAYQAIAGLENLDLTKLAAYAWNSIPATVPASTGKLLFELTPASGSSATGLQELEIWTAAGPVNVKSGDALLAKLLDNSAPPQGRLYQALNAGANPTVGIIGPSGSTADDPADNTFSFTLDHHPGHFVRAWLSYELTGAQHWMMTRRSINGATAQGGVLWAASDTWAPQIEKLNPAWLKQGTNTIAFSLPSGVTGNYTVRNVRLVAELDTGANVIEALTADQPDTSGSNLLAAVMDGDLGTGWKPYPSDQPVTADAPVIEFEFARPTQLDAFSFYLSAPIEGQLKLSVKLAGAWQTFDAQQGAISTSGWNTIYVPDSVPLQGRIIEGLSVQFPGGYVSSAEFREVLFIGSGVNLDLSGLKANPPQVRRSGRLEVAFPDAGQFYGRYAYVRGFVAPPDDGSGIAAISVGGVAATHTDGAYGVLISKDNAVYNGSKIFAAQGDNEPWWVEVKATYKSGQTVTRNVDLSNQLQPAAPITGDVAGSTSATVTAKRSKTITHDESKLAFDTGTVSTDTTITVTPLRDDEMPALDAGMVNVTKGPRRGYRYLPHGAKFLKNVTVTLPYDKALIPPGYTESHIRTYYFDEQAGRWVALACATVDASGACTSIDKTNKLVNSLTNHFTDMINAVVTVPDHPEAVSFNPTSMKDIKAADPGAQVNLIEAPGANNMGDARLSYPIEVPPGRQGLQPSLAVSYNSSGGNGWMGMGWDLATQAITIDTRFGVPRYSGTHETETYTLNGEMLTPVAHRGELKRRSDGTTILNGETVKIFHTRVEGEFRKIIRHGSSPSTYWWEVVDKNGGRSIYGGNFATKTQDANSVLKTDGGPVFRWALKEVRDLNGNRMVYAYDTVNDVGVAGGTVAGRQLYLRQIAYTDHPTSPARYTVTFARDTAVAPDRRADVIIDGRGGFKQVTANLLKRIEVRYDTALVRAYEFDYQEGVFKKTLLKSVTQLGDDDKPFNTHTFRYHDDITSGASFAGFSSSTDWDTQDDSLRVDFLGVDAGPSALSGSEGIGAGASFSLGFAPFPTKYLSFNGMIGSGISQSNGTLQLADIDGDGLPDKVFLSGNAVRYHRNTVTPTSNPLVPITFESAAPVAEDMGLLSQDQSMNFNFGGQAYIFGLNLITDVGHNFTQQPSYVTDVNGDGLLDVVKGGQVWFNRWKNKNAGDYTPVFTATSAGSEVPIGAGAVDASGMLPEADFAAIEKELFEHNPLADVVRRWVAPYAGHISIDGDVQLVDVLNDPTATPEEKQKRLAYKTADGVRVAIERPGLKDPLWKQDIDDTDFAIYTPSNTSNLSVNKGDAIYFRVQSQFDGAYDEVKWAPRIRYLDTTAGGSVPADTTDVNKLDPYVFRADQEFVYAGRVNAMETPFKGKVRVTGLLDKTAITSDDVRISIYQFTDAEFQAYFTSRRDYTLLHTRRTPVVRYSARWDLVTGLRLDGTPDIAVEPRDKLLVLVEVDSNIDLTKLQWSATNPLRLFYTEAYRPTEQPSETQGGAPLVDESGNPIGWAPGAPISVQDSDGKYVMQIPPQFEINFYPDNALNQAQADFTATETGWLMANPQVTPKPVTVPGPDGTPVTKYVFSHDSEMTLTVKQRGELGGKRVVLLPAGKEYVPQQHSFAVPVYKGDKTFFDFSTRDPELYPTLDGTAVSVHYIRPQSIVTLGNIPINQGGSGSSWSRAAGTVTVLPQLGASPGTPALSGEVVLHVQHSYTGADGSPVTETLVERRIDFDTQAPFSPYAHAFDLPEGGSYAFRYSSANADLAAALTTRAVTIAIQTNYAATQQEFGGLTLFTVPPSVPNSDTGKALLPVGDSAAVVAIAPVITQNGALVSQASGEARLTVVRRTADGETVIAERAVTLTAGKRFNPGEYVFDIVAEANDTLVMYFTTEDGALAGLGLEWGVWTQTRHHTGGNVPAATPPSMLHRYGYWDLFAAAYRGWAYAGYNSEGEVNGVLLKNQPIIADRLKVSSNNSDYQVPSDPAVAQSKRVKDFIAFPAAAQAEHYRWYVGDEMWRVKADRMAASRMGLDYVHLPRATELASSVSPDPAGAGATAPPRLSIVANEQTRGVGFIVNINDTTTPGQGLLDFMDMNGDRFPDVVGGNQVQYTEMVGGLGGTRGSTGTPYVRDSLSVAHNIAPGGTIQQAIATAKGLFNDKGGNANTSNRNSNFGMTGSLGHRENDVKAEYLDVNADGLPDRVYDDDGSIRAALNLGYRFADPEPWGSAVVDDSETRYINGGGSASFNDGVKGFAGSMSITHTLGKTRTKLLDINGDGLPDRITESAGNLSVGINKGNGFDDDKPWTGVSTTLANNQSFSKNGGVSFNITVGPLCIAACYIDINPGVSISNNTARAESLLQDVNGDGYADRVASTTDSKMAVALNRTGRTNLLKTYLRPLGARVDLEYTRDGNTFDMPQSRWLVTKVTVHDGHAGQGADLQVRTIQYKKPKYNRLEREFYGYGEVTEYQRDTMKSEAVYRSVMREYRNDSFYTKGLLSRELVQDADGKPYTETENQYQVRDEDTGLDLANSQSTVATGFPQLVRTDKRFYEGGTTAVKKTYTTHEYDKYGNAKTFIDTADEVPGDDVQANIEYSWLDPVCEANHIVGLARKIEVYATGTLARHREAGIDCATGDVKQVRQYLADGQVAVTDIEYFANGNLQWVKGPFNLKKTEDQRYKLTYEYDPQVATHVSKIIDSFGLTSTATHNYLYGKVETTTDTNGNQSVYQYDQVGRVKEIRGPYELTEGTPTLAFKYALVKTPTVDGQGNTVALTETPWALTEHVDKDAQGAYKASGTIDTILFIDGLKRVLQTKKDATVLDDGATQPLDKMTVSGEVTFDAFGRTVAQRYPVTEAKGTNLAFNPATDSVAPTVTEYDVLDRVTKTTLPDGSLTTIDYGFGPDRSGTAQFETVVRDANVNAGAKGAVKATYRDVRDLITAVKELNKAGTETIWTSYAYDPLKQIVEVKDDQGNLTKVSYDHLGRRTAIDNPDTGLTTFGYDLASNLTAKVTANLRAQTKELSYDYDFNRLKTVAFPVNPDLTVRYSYGAPGAANNTAGRITRVVSRATATSQGIKEDSEERQYGKLGEVTYEKKTVVPFSDTLHPLVFETRYQYDTFGRLLELTYPDGELLTNVYDSGGNLKSAKGVKGVSTDSTGVYDYHYLHGLYYDKFEQRVLMEQGNGVKTAYTYNAQTRRLHGLTAGRSNGTLFQNLEYGYDRVGNVLSLKNITDMPLANVYGGPAFQRYEYDDLYRLTKAQGVFPYNKTGADPTVDACAGSQNTHCRVYVMDMVYDTVHNIRTKTQTDKRYPPGASAIDQKKTSYNWTYDYNPSGPASTRPHAPNHIGQLSYQYDANGNQLGWTNDLNGTKRTIVWDEENRILSLFDNGHEKTYKYDDQGTRTIKRGPQGETVYVNQFYTQRPGATGTKHVYAGTSRIASKLLRQDVPGANPAGKTPYEKDIYFYHPDHLGSSSYVTDLNARIYEHLEYFPFGEGWIEENSNVQRTPYLFTAKELDEETGLYYFGARYYDPRTSVWQSADPIFAKYLPVSERMVKLNVPTLANHWTASFDLPGMGGVFNSPNLDVYAYTHGNPVRYVDPDGNSPTLIAAGIGAVAGGVIGGGWSVASDLWNNREVDWGQAGRSALKGAVGGAVAGATFGLVAPAAGSVAMQAVNAGASRALPNVVGAAVGAGSGAAGDVAAQGTAMGLGWQEDFSWGELGMSTALGGAFGSVGREFKIGNNARVAPFGNRAGHPTGTLPHYHRRVPDPAKSGQSLPGQGMGRHRPWDSSPQDKTPTDRF